MTKMFTTSSTRLNQSKQQFSIWDELTFQPSVLPGGPQRGRSTL